jgi:hypothetical protein
VIDKALSVLNGQLNAFLNTRFGPSGNDLVALGPVPDANKETPPAQPLTLSLGRIEEERVVKTQTATRKRDSVIEDIQPDIKLNLFLLASSHGNSYSDALRFLSATVLFFQSRPAFDQTNCPGLDPAIEKLLVELYSQSFEEQNHLWGSLSLRYVPSVLYRVRLLIIQEGTPQRTQPPVSAMVTTPGRV